MDHLERIGYLLAKLAAAVALSALAAACIADDGAASFGRGSTTEPPLPTTTRPETSTTATGEESVVVVEDPPPTTAPLEPLLGLAAEIIAEGFDQPILVTSAPGGDALYVVEREGLVWKLDAGIRGEEPFLDLRDQLLSSSIEQGLLGLAFHPDYAANGRLFAYWTDQQGDSVLGQFIVTEPDAVDASTLEVVLQVEQPAERHNSGMILFGPDGLLYLSLGDGGSGGSTAQDTSNLLGSILRLDVDSRSPYAVPEGNPFGDEIWVYGLRNPWRFSIDPVDELMYIGDVGQETTEEINVIGLDEAGTNFGWFRMEGDACFRSGCDTTGLTDPVLQYSRDEGCSVTGGWVYRGPAIPEFDGHYFFADWCKGFVRSMRFDNGRVVDQFDWTSDLDLGQVTSFGLDDQGELYIVSWDGRLAKIIPVR